MSSRTKSVVQVSSSSATAAFATLALRRALFRARFAEKGINIKAISRLGNQDFEPDRGPYGGTCSQRPFAFLLRLDKS